MGDGRAEDIVTVGTSSLPNSKSVYASSCYWFFSGSPVSPYQPQIPSKALLLVARR